MMIFLLAILLLYGLLHLYVYHKINTAIALGTVSIVLLISFMAIMALAPVFVRLSEKYEFESFGRYLSLVGYTWMGLVFVFFLCSLLVDVYRLAIFAGGMIFKTNYLSLLPSAKAALAMASFIAAGIVVYGFVEAVSIRTERVSIQSPKIPEQVGKITIAQISDVHLGLIVRHRRLKKILREVERAKPDILVSTGDLVDGQIGNLKGLGELLNNVDAPYGKFAVTGNHEFYAGLNQALRFTEKAGFTVLRDEVSVVARFLNIVGFDDPTGKRLGLSQAISEKSLLSKISHEQFTMLLKHQPVVDKDSAGYFDLQLSGHTHGGQIFPFTLLVWLFYPVDSGLTRLENGSYLYVSRGSGTWGPPIRFLSPPEVTIIELVHGRE
jgi:uncharacterized protein